MKKLILFLLPAVLLSAGCGKDHDGQRIKYKIGAEASIDYLANPV